MAILILPISQGDIHQNVKTKGNSSTFSDLVAFMACMPVNKGKLHEKF